MRHFSPLRSLCSTLFLAIAALFVGCNGDKQSTTTTSTPQESLCSSDSNSPFSADSAYAFVEKQVAFGPRVPNTPEHAACGEWLAAKLADFGAEVYLQKAEVKPHTGGRLPITNIIASYNSERSDRILLLAHWDTRPKAENDPHPSLQDKPILGADDAGSGVAVLLEIARLMQQTASDLPIDILLVDAEDMGESNVEDSWCLGSTYWSRTPHTPGYKARYGILLDMVGARNAHFRWEYFSKVSAPHLLSAVWKTAQQLGYGKYFVQADGAALTDDHLPIINNMGIPTIDIVNYNPSRSLGFGDHWHTHEDTLEVIDKEVLKAVGETLWQVINTY